MYPPADSPDVCHLYLIRHGATPNNELNPPRIQGQTSDDSLSATGRRQAEATARLLAKFPIAAVYSSPMRRAAETAEAVAAPHGVSVRKVQELAECDVGDWGGMTWPEIEASQPERHRLFLDDPATHGYAGGENLTQLVQRVAPAFDEIVQTHIGRSVVAVAHNVVNRAYLAQLLAIPPARGRNVYQDNCGVNVIRYRQDGSAKVLIMNSAFHLRDLG